MCIYIYTHNKCIHTHTLSDLIQCNSSSYPASVEKEIEVIGRAFASLTMRPQL